MHKIGLITAIVFALWSVQASAQWGGGESRSPTGAYDLFSQQQMEEQQRRQQMEEQQRRQQMDAQRRQQEDMQAQQQYFPSGAHDPAAGRGGSGMLGSGGPRDPAAGGGGYGLLGR